MLALSRDGGLAPVEGPWEREDEVSIGGGGGETNACAGAEVEAEAAWRDISAAAARWERCDAVTGMGAAWNDAHD